jgi:hypothetical protein
MLCRLNINAVSVRSVGGIIVTDESVIWGIKHCSATLCGRHLHKNLAFVCDWSTVYTEAVMCNAYWCWMHTS